MRSIIFILLFMLVFAPAISADILIGTQPSDIYSLGDKLDSSIVLTTTEGIYDYLQTSIVCGTHEQKLSKTEISLESNDQITVDKSISLIKKFIGDSLGICKMKFYIEENPQDAVFSNEFEISNLLVIDASLPDREFEPGDNVSVTGTVEKGNGQIVEGFVNLTLILGSQEGNSSGNQIYTGVVDNGKFSINFQLPKDIKAGSYVVDINSYEKDPLGTITNYGSDVHNLVVKQIPTSLEVFFNNPKVNPGENLRVKAVLHDQTGENILSTAILTVKNENDKILEQGDLGTDEFLEFPIEYNQAPKEWSVVAVSNKLTSEGFFTILEKEDVNVEIVNNTLVLTNVGNVPYNKTLLIKIGNETININPVLKVDESKKYSLKAPSGEYDLEVILPTGESKITGNVALTGRSVEVKEISGLKSFFIYPLAWIFILLVLGFISYMVYRKGFKKTFLGRIKLGKFKFKRHEKDKSESKTESPRKNINLVDSKENLAEMSLSIKGDKQKSSIVALRIKNSDDVKRNVDVVESVFDKIEDIAEESKARIYENQGNLFFILAPIVTKTFKNDKTALSLAGKISDALKNHNRLSRQKVEFGIAVNSGDIIASMDNKNFKFMAFGNFLTDSKKVAAMSEEGKIYLTKEARDGLISNVKAKKIEDSNIEAYVVEAVKGDSPEKHKKFLSEFIKRLEGDKEKENKKG